MNCKFVQLKGAEAMKPYNHRTYVFPQRKENEYFLFLNREGRKKWKSICLVYYLQYTLFMV